MLKKTNNLGVFFSSILGSNRTEILKSDMLHFFSHSFCLSQILILPSINGFDFEIRHSQFREYNQYLNVSILDDKIV